MDAHLRVVEGRPLGAVIHLKPGQLTIGRDPSCQLRPKSPTVSQFHCALIRRGDEVTVSDQGSSNGTLVNDQFLQPGEAVRLDDGDRLQVGQLIFAFRTAAAPGPANGTDLWEDHAGPAPGDDPSARTLLIAAPGAAEEAVGAASVASSARSSAIAYREFDHRTRATCLGLNRIGIGDEARIRAIREVLAAVRERSPQRRIILDLGAVDVLPSLAVSTLLATALQCRAAGGGLRLCGLRPAVERMIVALKLDAAAGLYEGRDAALIDPWD